MPAQLYVVIHMLTDDGSIMNSIYYDIQNGTVDIYLSETSDRSEYVIYDPFNQLVCRGCFFGRISKTCLFVGELKSGTYILEINGLRIDFIV